MVIPSDASKGKLIYQEEWASKKKYKDRSHIVMGPVIMGMGILLIALGIWISFFDGAKDPIPGLLFLAGIGAFVFFLGFGMFRSEIKTMPFRVYEQGFTLPTVPLREGFRRKESLVDWSRLNRASLESYTMYTAALRKIKLIYDDDKELDLSVYYLTDPFEVIKALKRLVPEKMDSNFNIFVGNEEEREIVKKPMPLKASKYKWAMPILMAIFILILSGSMAPLMTYEMSNIIALLMLMCVFTPIAGLMVYFSFDLEKHAQKELVHYEAKATEVGLEFPKTLLGRMIRNIRTTIPYDEIKIVRMKLEPLFYSHEAEFETAGGERFWAPFQVYEKVSGFEKFRLEEYDYVNRSPSPSRGPIITTNKSKSLVYIALIASTFLVGPIFAGAPIELFSRLRYVCIILVFLILLPLLFYSYWVMGKRNRVSGGLLASDKGIHLPNAPEKLRYISKNEFIDARVDKDLFGYYCELNTAKGHIKLNQVAAERLISGGYRVENAQGLAQIPPRGYREIKKPVEEKRISVPRKLGPGALLLEENVESFVAKKRKLNHYGAVMLVGGIAAIIVPILLIQIYASGFYLCFPLMFVFIGSLLLCLGAVILRSSMRAAPIRIYENGIVFPEIMRKEGEIFVPYGRMKTYSETKLPIWGDVVQFHLEGTTKFIVQKSIPGFLEVFQQIKERIGEPEYDSADFQLFSEESYKKMAMLLYGLIFTIGYGFAIGNALISGFTGIQSFVSQVLLFGSAFSLVFLPYMVYTMEFKKRNNIFSGRVRPKRVVIMAVALLILFSIGWVTQVPEVKKLKIYHDSPPAIYLYSEGNISDTHESLTDNIYVPPNSRLTIINSTLTFSLSSDKQYSIYVAKDGFLSVINSTLTTDNYQYGFGFEIYGGAQLIDSRFSHIYGSEEINNGEGGLEIFSDDVLISNCSISNNRVNGILIADSSPTIEDCVIENNRDDGIEMQNSDAIISNSSLRNNGWAVIVNSECEARIEGNRFDGNSHGVVVYGSKPTIINNEFRNTENYAIYLYENSDPTLEGNTFENNGEDIENELPLGSIYSICSIIGVIIGLVATLIVIIKIKNKRKKNERTEETLEEK